MSGPGQREDKAGGEPKPRPTFALTLLVLIGFLSVSFFIQGYDLYVQGELQRSMWYFVLGFIGIGFAALMANKLMGRLTLPPPKVTLTVIQCSKCDFKNVRKFEAGDYIPKPAGSCPNCGGAMNIEAIYAEETKPPKKGIERRL